MCVIHGLNKQRLNTYSVPGTVVDKDRRNSVPMGFRSSGELCAAWLLETRDPFLTCIRSGHEVETQR